MESAVSRPSILVSDGRDQIDDERIDFAQVFAPAFLRFQFAIAHDDGQIPDFVQYFPGDGVNRPVRSESGDTDQQVIFETRNVRFSCRSQIAVQGVKFRFQHG